MANWGFPGVAGRGVTRLVVPTARRLVVPTAASLLLMGIAAAQASAATISVTKPCYVNSLHERASMTVVGSGFTPGIPVEITSSDGTVAEVTTASSTGTITLTTGAPAPLLNPLQRKTVTLTAQVSTVSGTAIVATTQATVTPLSVVTRPARAKFTRKVTWFFSGFEPGKPIYAHYLRRRPVAKTRFGKAKGACGVLKARALLFPGGHPRFKTYRVQIDDSKHYSKHTLPRFVTTLGTFVT